MRHDTGDRGFKESCRPVLPLKAFALWAGPPIPFGVSLHLMDFPGTISLTPATLTTLITEICTCLVKHGFRKLVLLVAHAENIGAVYAAAQDLSQQPEVRVLVINWLPVLRKHNPLILKSKWGGHGGEGETAAVLAAAPGLARMDRAQVSPFPPKGKEKVEGDDPVARWRWRSSSLLFRAMAEESPVGFFGDPTIATAETGEKYYDVIVDFSCQVIKKRFRPEVDGCW